MQKSIKIIIFSFFVSELFIIPIIIAASPYEFIYTYHIIAITTSISYYSHATLIRGYYR